MALGAFIAVFGVYQFYQPSSSQKLMRKNPVFSQVSQGDFSVRVEGFGVLASNRQKRLTSRTSATVDEIVLKPDAAVEPEQGNGNPFSYS